jgi:hypothetical protein
MRIKDKNVRKTLIVQVISKFKEANRVKLGEFFIIYIKNVI